MPEQDVKDADSCYKFNVIRNYDDLIQLLSNEKQRLNDKYEHTYWRRYFFRRAPLFFGAGMTFFIACLLMVMMKQIDLKSIDSFLNDLITPAIREHHYTIFAIYLLFVLIFIIRIINCCEVKLGKFYGRKIATKALLFSLLVVIFITIISNKHPLFFGLAAFSTLTLFSLLIDRVLGYTRRNERYQLFAGRAEGLCVLFASREQLGIKFQESHLLELAKFYEELRQSKYNDTVADSHYLLTLVEQLKAPSK